jgi:hypothetical protein
MTTTYYIEERTNRRCRITATNGNWQVEIAYVDADGKDISPSAIAWLSPKALKREKA